MSQGGTDPAGVPGSTFDSGLEGQGSICPDGHPGSVEECLTATPAPSPAAAGLVFWVKGDAGLVPSSDGLRLLTWANSAIPSFNPGLVSAGADGIHGPAVGLATIDGIPCVSYSHTDPGAYYLVQLGAAQLWKDRTGTLFGYGAGETQPRTTFSVVRPVFSPTIFNIVGGTLLRFGNTPTGGPQDFETLFDLEPLTDPNAWFLFSNNWRNGFAAALQGPHTPGGAGGPYSGVPVVVQHSSSGFNNITVRVNGQLVALTPNVMEPPDGGHPIALYAVYGAVDQAGDVNGQWHGDRCEDLIYDVDLESTPAALTQTWAYLASRYPSAPIVVP